LKNRVKEINQNQLHNNGKNNEAGNILLSSLLIMIAMNLLAITLMQISVKENETANFKTVDSFNFYLADSCLQDVITYFEGQDSPPQGTIPSIERVDLSHLYSGNEKKKVINQLSKYSYDCDVASLTVKSVEATEFGYGDNIGSGDSYGASGDLSPKYFYEVNSNGSGPDNSAKNIISILSVEY